MTLKVIIVYCIFDVDTIGTSLLVINYLYFVIIYYILTSCTFIKKVF